MISGGYRRVFCSEGDGGIRVEGVIYDFRLLQEGGFVCVCVGGGGGGARSYLLLFQAGIGGCFVWWLGVKGVACDFKLAREGVFFIVVLFVGCGFFLGGWS